MAEGSENVLDVSVVYEQHKFVADRLIVASLDEQLVFWIWGLVKPYLRQWVYVHLRPEKLDDLLNPVVQHVNLVFVFHGKIYLQSLAWEMVNTKYEEVCPEHREAFCRIDSKRAGSQPS
jgi:hypothetical protein